MIDIICFSKDTAMQQELFLRTTKEKLHYPHKIIVQYATSSPEHDKAYLHLASMYDDVAFIKETNFRDTLNKVLSQCKSEYIMFEVGDSVWINDLERDLLERVLPFLTGFLHSISLRLHPNATYCYPARKEMQPPKVMVKNDGLMQWDWTKCDLFTCWGYPLGVVATIYKTDYIKQLVHELRYSNVNSLEDAMIRKRDFNKPLMIAPLSPKLFNVQNTFTKQTVNSYEKEVYSVEDLNNRFLNGERISTDNIYGLERNMCHGPLEFKFIKGE